MRLEIQKKSTLLDALQQLSPESSKSSLKSWVEQGRVYIDDRQIDSIRLELKPGQVLKVGPKVGFAGDGIRILYEDGQLVVIDKPEKLLSVASLDDAESNVHAILRRRAKKRVFPVHRLDKDTSGILVFAYTEKARDHLKEQFANHTIDRIYYAAVEGTLVPAKGTWKSRLIEDDSYFVKSGPTGKLAITHYEVIESKANYSLVKFKLETGRKNQIRVHASEAGYPIVGDLKYGAQTRRRRLCLHAHILAFTHPIRKKRMKFVSPVPEFKL